MITITAKIHDVTSSPFTDKETGVITIRHTAELIHKLKGKSVITALGIDETVCDAWRKSIGKETINEIGVWLMNGKAGFNLVDKKSLPTVQRAASV